MFSNKKTDSSACWVVRQLLFSVITLPAELKGAHVHWYTEAVIENYFWSSLLVLINRYTSFCVGYTCTIDTRYSYQWFCYHFCQQRIQNVPKQSSCPLDSAISSQTDSKFIYAMCQLSGETGANTLARVCSLINNY